MGTPVSNILRLFTNDVNAIQKVLLMNCPGLLANGQPPDFQSYWITKLDNVQKPDTIDPFFFNISNIQLLSTEQTNCACKEVFLEMFVDPLTDDDISLDIKSAIAMFDKYYKYKLQYIMKDIKVSYDAELMLRYQETILTRIMYLIFSRVIIILNNKSLPMFIIHSIIIINRIISEDRNEFPTIFVNVFSSY